MRHGGTTILSETSEIYGAEHLLTRRAETVEVGEKLIERIRPVIAASRGRAFLLFTSYRSMHAAATLLRDTIDYPILMQGDQPKHQLLEHFREAGNAVLLGTSSFWEGVDVRGEALSCVIIDRLPFASPADPILQARMDVLRRVGEEPAAEARRERRREPERARVEELLNAA